MGVIPLILSGGVGTRLWPLSRGSRPKQFLRFGHEWSLFQDTVRRCRGATFDGRPIIVGANDHRFLLADDLLLTGVKADILLEPVAKGSCAAIAAGCLQALTRSLDACVLVLAADHHIPDNAAFNTAVEDALIDAHSGRIVTFGIKPNWPATSYGYILPGNRLQKAFSVDRFVEKPILEQAERYLAKGYLWNSGNFLFSAAVFLEELKRFAPDILESVSRAFDCSQMDLDFLRLDEVALTETRSCSIDCAVMERTTRAAVLPVEYRWADIGSWDGLETVLPSDRGGNVAVGNVVVVDGQNNVVHSMDRLTTLLGVQDTAVISTRDALLVVPKSRASDVKSLVASLQERGHSEATEALQIFRPWGNYERLDLDEGYQVKRITVAPGGVLSLQKHRHRAEHWVVVRGEVEVTIDGDVRLLSPGQSAYVPLGAIHRLANRRAEPAVLIEVQTGDYLGEDDIVRLEDAYNRGSDLRSFDRDHAQPLDHRTRRTAI